jgi:hypothetical protein
MGGEAIDFREN